MTDVFISPSGQEGEWKQIAKLPDITKIDEIEIAVSHPVWDGPDVPGHRVYLKIVDGEHRGRKTFSLASGPILEERTYNEMRFDDTGRTYNIKHESVSRGKERI